MRKQIRNMRRSSCSTLCLELMTQLGVHCKVFCPLRPFFWTVIVCSTLNRSSSMYMYASIRPIDHRMGSFQLFYSAMFFGDSPHMPEMLRYSFRNRTLETETYAHMQGSGGGNMAFNCSHGGCPPTINECLLYMHEQACHILLPRRLDRGSLRAGRQL
jgi:hypothetical protein